LVLFARREYAAAGQRLNDAATALETCEARRELARTRLYQLQLGYANRQRRALEETFQSLESLLAELGYSGFLLGDAGRARDVLAYGASMQWLGPRLSGLLSSVATAAEPQQAEVAEVAPQRAARSRQAQSAAEALPPVQAWALGPGKVRCGGRDITDLQWRSPKSKELFFYLLCNPGWQRRDQIVVDIWGEVSPAQARAGFHSNAHRLRRALHPDILQERHGRYQLNPHLSCWLDAAEFQDLSKELPGRAFSQRVATRGHEALQLYKGSFLEEFISSWVQQPRQQMESLFVDVAIWLGRFHALKGQHSRAIELAKRALAVQPYLEDAHELMIICHVAAGERAAALQQYLDYAALLEDDLDEAPSERMETLYRRIQDGGPVRLPVSGSVRTVSPRRRLGYGTQAALAATA
jgi:two-component SAPR family response regulator